MKKPNDSDTQLKLVEDADAPLQLKIIDDAQRLNPDTSSNEPIKTHEPDVDEILNHEEIVLDLEQAWSERNKTPPVGWFVLTGLVICGLVAWVILSLFKAQPEIKAAHEVKQVILENSQKETIQVQQVLQKMEDCARNYLAADSLESLLPYVRHPERVKPLMEAYYQTHPIKPEEFERFNRIRSMGLAGLSFVYTDTLLTNGKSHKILLEELEDGSFVVDWESDVCYQPMKWEEYIKNRPPEAVDMRVKITIDNFYAYEFKNESDLQCFKIKTRDSNEYLFGYLKKGTEVANDIQRIVIKSYQFGSKQDIPMILRLRFPKDSHSKRCVWIDAMLAPRWTYAKPPVTEQKTNKLDKEQKEPNK